jgi:hypothetical protein
MTCDSLMVEFSYPMSLLIQTIKYAVKLVVNDDVS